MFEVGGSGAKRRRWPSLQPGKRSSIRGAFKPVRLSPRLAVGAGVIYPGFLLRAESLGAMTLCPVKLNPLRAAVAGARSAAGGRARPLLRAVLQAWRTSQALGAIRAIAVAASAARTLASFEAGAEGQEEEHGASIISSGEGNR